jgi:predicted GNAT family acetyltransferase
MSTEVRHNAAGGRYELLLDGDVVGFADYRISGDAAVFPHTVIDPAYRGRGLGAVLVRGALDDVRSTGRTVVPRCWYVADFIRDNQEYQDLLAS